MMRPRRFVAIGVGAMLLLGASTSIAQTRNQQHAQQVMQQQMQQLQQQMNQLNVRSHEVGLALGRQMEVTLQEQEQTQLRQMLRMNEQLGLMAGQVKNAAERCELMLRDPELIRDREMEREMEQLRTHLQDMGAQIGDAVQSMERMTKRINERVNERDNGDM